MTSDETKLEELILYFAERLVDDGAAGATKLNKLLYFCDFVHMREHGRPITGVEYQRLPQGPAPRRLLPARDRLVARGEVTLQEEDYRGHTQHRLVAMRPAALDVFDADERKTIEAVYAELGHLTGTQLSALSHAEPGWALATDRDGIPYSTAFLRPAMPGPRTAEIAAKLLAELPSDIAERR